MKKILLVCASGMSTSMLIKKMETAAAAKGVAVSIQALPAGEAATVIHDMDIVLLGPQVRFQKEQIENLCNKSIPVSVIDMRDYGTMNGEKILGHALELMG